MRDAGEGDDENFGYAGFFQHAGAFVQCRAGCENIVQNHHVFTAQGFGMAGGNAKGAAHVFMAFVPAEAFLRRGCAQAAHGIGQAEAAARPPQKQRQPGGCVKSAVKQTAGVQGDRD